ncbi:MAG TPA: glycosyltransferase, partial [Bryobacteraceae bacterium]|nr:glycosyltransferase [Bryobacteraceae bacterium]
AASGLPAVATAVGGVEDVVIDGRTGFVVPPGDATAFANAMRRIVRMTAEERSRMGQAARDHAAANFDIRAVVLRWERLYTQLLTLVG